MNENKLENKKDIKNKMNIAFLIIALGLTIFTELYGIGIIANSSYIPDKYSLIVILIFLYITIFASLFILSLLKRKIVIEIDKMDKNKLENKKDIKYKKYKDIKDKIKLTVFIIFLGLMVLGGFYLIDFVANAPYVFNGYSLGEILIFISIITSLSSHLLFSGNKKNNT